MTALRMAPVTLAGRFVRLEPLSLAHLDALLAIGRARHPSFALTLVPDTEAGMRRYIETALADQAAGRVLPFATIEARGDRVVGSTRFLDIQFWTWPPGSPLRRAEGCPDVAEIGATWLTAEAQRTALNTEAKLLMLTHAFEVWQVHRVSLKTDARNERSRLAIERLGARFDGVLRAERAATDGTPRDSAYYSIVQAEWPGVRERLRARLG